MNALAAVITGLATAVLAVVTWQLVRVTRLLSPTPDIAVGLWFTFPLAFLEVSNAGTATAADIDVTITYTGAGGGAPFDGPRRWRTPTLHPAERVRFNVPGRAPDVNDPLPAEELAKVVDDIVVQGTYRFRGRAVVIDQRIGDLADLWDSQVGSFRHLRPATSIDRAVEDLDSIRDSLKTIGTSSGDLAAALREKAATQPADQ